MASLADRLAISICKFLQGKPSKYRLVMEFFQQWQWPYYFSFLMVFVLPGTNMFMYSFDAGKSLELFVIEMESQITKMCRNSCGFSADTGTFTGTLNHFFQLPQKEHVKKSLNVRQVQKHHHWISFIQGWKYNMSDWLLCVFLPCCRELNFVSINGSCAYQSNKLCFILVVARQEMEIIRSNYSETSWWCVKCFWHGTVMICRVENFTGRRMARPELESLLSHMYK